MDTDTGTGELGSGPCLPVRSPRARAVQAIRDWIDRGKLQPGDRIPAEQSLASSLDIARGTVRQALSELVAEGLLEKQAHRGHLVSRDIAATHSPLMTRTCVLMGELDDSRVPVPGYDEAVIAGAAQRLREAVYNRLSLHPSMLRREELARLIRARPAGCIACHESWQDDRGRAFVEGLHAAGVPLVVHGEGPWAVQFDHCASDQAAGAMMLTRLLIERGRRRILLASTTQHPPDWLVARLRGIHQTLAEAKLPPLRQVTVPLPLRARVEAERNFRARVRSFAGSLVEHLRGTTPVDAVMVLSDSDTPAVIQAARQCQVDPERDLDVVGYDHYWPNETMWERRFEALPPLATVDKRNAAVGRGLVDLMVRRIKGRSGPEPRELLIEPELVKLR